MVPIAAARASVVRLPWDRGGVVEPHAPRCTALALALSAELCSACAIATDAGVRGASPGAARLLGGVQGCIRGVSERLALLMGEVHAGRGLQKRTGWLGNDAPLALCMAHLSASKDVPAAYAMRLQWAAVRYEERSSPVGWCHCWQRTGRSRSLLQTCLCRAWIYLRYIQMSRKWLAQHDDAQRMS